MIRQALRVGLMGGLLLSVSFAVLSESRGYEKYQYCLTCHGSTGQGNRVVEAPAIKGADEYFLRRQLQDYRAQKRGAHIETDPTGAEMAAVARGLDDEEIPKIAGFLQSLQRNPPQHDGVSGDFAKGKANYNKVCGACHGPLAQGSEPLQAPALDHLNDWYLVSSFNKYLNGVRGGANEDISAQQMRAIAQNLPEGFLIEDVAVYIRSLRNSNNEK